VRESSPHFPVFAEFRSCSYAERYNLLCQKVVKENLYTASAFLASPQSAVKTGRYIELDPLTSLRSFLAHLAGHIAAESAVSL